MLMEEMENTDKVVASCRYWDMARVWLSASLQAHDFVPRDYWMSNEEAMRNIYLPASENYAFIEDGELRGFISLNGDRVEALFVDPEYQGRGIGHLLLDRAKTLRRMLTLSVYEDNGRAVRFYRQNGFAVTGRRVDEGTGCSELSMKWHGKVCSG